MAKRRLKWIGTTGGPILVVPEKHAPHWEGVSEPSHGRVVRSKHHFDKDGPATDYDRACDIDGYIGVLKVGRGRGIVLNDCPFLTAHHSLGGRHFLIRWSYAPGEKELLEFFASKVDRLTVAEEVEFRHPGGRMVLCDSSDTPRDWMGDHAEFDLAAGAYRVTASCIEEGECGVIVHEFVPTAKRSSEQEA